MIKGKEFFEKLTHTNCYNIAGTNEKHIFIPYSTTTHMSEKQRQTHLNSVICQKCLLLVGLDDEYHAKVSDIVKLREG